MIYMYKLFILIHTCNTCIQIYITPLFVCEGSVIICSEIDVITDGEGEKENEEIDLVSYAKASLKEVVQCAGLTHIDCVLKPILT